MNCSGQRSVWNVSVQDGHGDVVFNTSVMAVDGNDDDSMVIESS